jgi:3-phosphoshikimate 1-carboxyvinyltransferase
VSNSAKDELWAAPVATAPVSTVVRVPGSKSVTNRALVLAALANGPSVISHPLIARDTKLMVAGLTSLGAKFEEVTDGWKITPSKLTGNTEIDCGLAGTVMRFLPPVAALVSEPVRFDGDPRARVRPMQPIVEALRELGAKVDDDGRGTLPFTVTGISELKGEVTIDASASSQFVSALLLVGAKMPNGITITHNGNSLPSIPHIDMSVEMLRERGVNVEVEITSQNHAVWKVLPGPIHSIDYVIEPDLSNALPFIAAAMVTKGSVTIPDWPSRSTQPGAQLPALLEQMGATTKLDDSGLDDTGLTVTGPETLLGLTADLRDVGELTPVLAALCALATTPSHLSGIAHLRGHETDRLTALATEINKCGGDVSETDDGLIINPAPLHASVFETYEDHRMATAGAVIGLKVDGIQVVDIATTSKTLPDFAGMWNSMLKNSKLTGNK